MENVYYPHSLFGIISQRKVLRMFLIKMQVVSTKQSLLKMSSQLDIVLAKINQQYQSDYYQPWHRVDSLNCECVTHKGIYVLEIMDKLRFSLPETTVRFGVGYVEQFGDGTYNLSKAVTLADKALGLLHQHDDYGNAHVQFNFGRKNSFEKMINESLRLCDFMVSRWRKSQSELVSYLILNYGYMDTFVQKEIAEALNLSPQNLNQQLKNSGYYNLIRMKRELTVVLEQFRRSV